MRCLSPQVHQHLPLYSAGIQEFQNRLDQLQIEQAKLSETLANDKRYYRGQGFKTAEWTIGFIYKCLLELISFLIAARR